MAISGTKPSPASIGAALPQGATAKAKGASAVQQAAASYAQTAAVGMPSKEAANVQISPKAKELSLARAAVDATPDIREDKVADFKKRIASGEYKPDAGKIADSIAMEAIKDELSASPEVALQ